MRTRAKGEEAEETRTQCKNLKVEEEQHESVKITFFSSESVHMYPLHLHILLVKIIKDYC